MDQGEETIADREELTRVRRQARRVWVKTLAVATVLTLAVWLLPS